jgi:formylmethanofuran dehydrogenase subunit C
MELFNNGKIFVSDSEVNIKGFISTTKIQRRHIKNISYIKGFGRVMAGIINCCLIVNMVKGIRMLSGKIYTTIWLHNGDKYNFWMTESEYNTFSNIV